MEKIKTVEIQDLEKKLKFRIRLFKAGDGLDFMDKLAALFRNNSTFSLKFYIRDLLPLATMIVEGQDEGIQMTLEKAETMIESPLAIIDLAREILAFQMVFTKNSATFQVLPNSLQNVFQLKTSE